MLSHAQVSSSSLQALNQGFTFDWNDYRTIESNKNKIVEIESAIEKAASFIETLEEKERLALGQLCYKLGAFYNHIKRTPAPAFEKLLMAEKLLADKELAWVKNHIAFSYQQTLAAAKKEKNVEKIEANKIQAMEYCNQVIKQNEKLENSDVEAIKITAFAYCVRALAEYEVDQLDVAVKSYRVALDLYEKHGLLDDQYARAKNRYAQFLVEQKNHVAANKTFEELEKYWSEKQEPLNPYPARFYVSYADYLVKMQPDNLALALEKYKKAYEILRVTDGEQSQFTKDIFKKWSDMTKILSPLEVQAKVYGSKSATLCHFKPVATVDSKAQVNQSGVKVEQSVSTLSFTGTK